VGVGGRPTMTTPEPNPPGGMPAILVERNPGSSCAAVRLRQHDRTAEPESHPSPWNPRICRGRWHIHSLCSPASNDFPLNPKRSLTQVREIILPKHRNQEPGARS